MQLKNIAKAIKATRLNRTPTLIAIEGFGGSGKSTIAKKLAELLGGVFVVSIDDFIVKDKLTKRSWDNGAFDHNRLERQVLIPATTDQPLSYQKLVWNTNTLSEPVRIPPVEYIVVEGISSYHPTIAQYYDYKIWVDTPINIAKERGRARDKGSENAAQWDRWAENDVAYQQKYHPEAVADFVVTNTQ